MIFNARNVTRRESTEYVYDASGIRVSSVQVTDEDGDGPGGSTVTTTTYLSDPHNHTGHAQVLEEVTRVGNDVTKRIVYTIGHDQISQTTIPYTGTGAGTPGPATTHTFHADGHGSTRALTDLLGSVAQRYVFDAYGNAVGFDPAAALTSYLYSGEHFDSRIGQQYLRARWYDATTGRFNRERTLNHTPSAALPIAFFLAYIVDVPATGGIGCQPAVGEQVVEGFGRCVRQLCEEVAEPGPGFDVVCLRAGDEAQEHCRSTATFRTADEIQFFLPKAAIFTVRSERLLSIDRSPSVVYRPRASHWFCV